MRCAWLVLVAACGRVAFDPRPDVATLCVNFGPWAAPRALAQASSAAADLAPNLSSDGKTLLFETQRVAATGNDIWIATRATLDDDFGPAASVSELNSATNDGDPALASDGLTVYLHSGRTDGTARIHRATRSAEDQPWSTPDAVPELLAEAAIGPAISHDGRELYYTLRDVGELRRAIATGGSFALDGPVAEIPPFAGWPSLTADGLTIVYTRKTVTYDLYTASRASPAEPFSGETPIAEVNGPTDDLDPDVSADGTTLVFGSDRGGNGDLYITTRSCLD